ncbi:synaptonemal complex protein 2-like isoform X2 [Hoplias malabaricus]|uniref:synaptonemal complex protein 2-like isoform X2 n=1 Tax=Hoplias malabaricus TaxID=27720 RepID=UPI003461D8E1
MNFARGLEDAFSGNNVLGVVTVIVQEKSAFLVDHLDEVVSKELQKNEFKNVTLILQAIEQLASKDNDCINQLVHQGIVIKVSEYIKMQQKPSKAPVQLIEAFYEASMSLCKSDIEGNSKILELLVLRFGAVVIDQEVKFDLRLEAVKTINSMLDTAPKESRKQICQSDDHNFLLEEFAKVIVDVGDYEMQVAISEALCRMTPKKQREDLAGKWFSHRSFASTFKTIRVKEFETDCRIFLNELNSYFGVSRRVFSIPCIRAFLEFTELFKPQDELLMDFWVDFNVGTLCISLFVDDPEGTLWELIHLPKEYISKYSLQENDGQKLLTVNMSVPVFHGNIMGKFVQIVFDSKHDIQTVAEKVFGKEDLQLPAAPKPTAAAEEDSGISTYLADDVQTFSSPPVIDTSRKPHVSFFFESGPGKLPSPIQRVTQREDTFCLKNESDTEVIVSEILNHTFLTEVSGKSHGRKPETITFMTALWRNQVARAKATIFGVTLSSNGSASSKSLPSTEHEKKSIQKRKLTFLPERDSQVPFSESHSSKETPRYDYTRKRPRVKSKLKVLPCSSPSSEEECFKESTPKHRTLEKYKTDCTSLPQSKVMEQELDTSYPSEGITVDSGFQGKTDLEEPVLLDEEPAVFIASGDGPPPPPRKWLPAESMSQALMEDEESENESGVTAAFNMFKAQLREHFSSSYKKIEAKSLRSLTDCQKTVTSLLRNAHNQRLVHLENFQDTVVQQLAQNCLSLKNIEQETVRFWQSECDSVKAFCDKQQMRLDSLDILKKNIQAPQSQVKSTEVAATEMPNHPLQRLKGIKARFQHLKNLPRICTFTMHILICMLHSFLCFKHKLGDLL